MARTVSIKVLADIAGFMAPMQRAVVATKEFSGELNKAAKGGHAEQITRSATAMGIGLLGAAGAAVKLRMDFDKSMSAAAAATNDSTKSAKENAVAVEQLRQAAIQAGKDTQFSATDAADGITELGKAGVHTSDILSGGLKGALDLAAAGQISVSEAAETSASALTQFKLSGAQIPHVADLLAAAAGKAQGSVHDIGAAMNQSGLVAAQFGLSIEDTVGALAEFASAGLTGSDAGTSFKTMLLAIANPTQQTKAEMDDLGISFYDAQGKFIGISGVAQVLQTRLKGLTDAQRQQALGQLFGNDAIRAASILYTDGADGVKKWATSVNDAGYANKTAAKLTDNLAGDLERLKGSVETLAISSSSGANGGLRLLVKGLDALVGKFLDLPPAISGTLTVMGGVGGASLLALAGFLKLRRGAQDAIQQLRDIGPAGERAATGLGRLGSIAGKVSLVVAALEAANQVASEFQADLAPKIDALSVGLEQYAKSGKTAGEASRVLGDNLGDLKKTFDLVADTSNSRKTWARTLESGLEAIVPGLKGTNSSLATTRERIAAVDAALAQMVSGGDAAGAQQTFDALSKALATNGVTIEEVRKQFPAYAAALETSQAATKGATSKLGDLNSALTVGASGQDKYKTAADAAAGAARGERDALGALFSTLKAETDPVFGLIDAQKKLKDAQKAYTDAVKQHGRKSAEARAADIDLAKSALDLQNSVGSLSDKFNGKLSPAFVNTLKAAGLTKTQIADVAKQFENAKKSADKYAGKYEAKTSAPGAVKAKTELDNAYASAHHLDGKWEAKTSAPGAVQSKKQLDDAHVAALNFDGLYQGKITTPGAQKAQADIDRLWARLKDVDGNWVAHMSTSNYTGVAGQLRHLLAAQQALKDSTSVNEANRELGHFFAGGGRVYGPGTATSDSIPARLSAGEYVIKASSVDKLGTTLLGFMNRTGQVPDHTQGFAGGGIVMPFVENVGKTKIPAVDYGLPGGGKAPGYKWMEKVVRAAFPGMPIYSDFRPGAITITGNRSYHGFGRAVDFAPSKPLAEWINLHYFRPTRELITPWQSLNIHNGARHTYSALVENQHNFAGGNAHDHWAMRGGGTITEPIFGVGASGRTYSFGENYQPERVVPGVGAGSPTYVISPVFTGPVGSQAQLENWLSASIDNLKRKGRM